MATSNFLANPRNSPKNVTVQKAAERGGGSRKTPKAFGARG